MHDVKKQHMPQVCAFKECDMLHGDEWMVCLLTVAMETRPPLHTFQLNIS